MDSNQPPRLSRRERQIMDVLHRLGRATAAEITAALDDAPTNTTVRTLLRILGDKGHVRVERDGKSYRLPARRRPRGSGRVDDEPCRSDLLRRLAGQGDGGAARARAETLSEAQLDRLERLIAEAREKGE